MNHILIDGIFIVGWMYAHMQGLPGGLVVKNLPANAEGGRMQVPSLSGEDPLEEDKATHSSILAWRTLGTEESGDL